MSRSETGLSPKPVQPEFCTDEHLEFLDSLRESGATNMLGGGAYIEQQFGLNRNDSAAILQYWMNTFINRHPS